ncbi:MAG: hypothetical protein ACK5FU_00555, partial [Bacteroidota bacterium]
AYLHALPNMPKVNIFTALLICFSGTAIAQTGFQQKTNNAGRIQLTASNAGTIGRPQVRSNVSGPASMAYPTKGLEHLFESGIWIGAMVNGQPLVSTSAVDASAGYSTGGNGFEFSPVAPPLERSKLTSSPNYSSSAVSHQDIVYQFSDESTVVPGTSIPISGHLNPLYAKVRLETYAWNFSFADFFVICNYEITNNSTQNWDSVWVGQWADLVVRNVNVTRDAGTAFFNKGRNAVDAKYKAVYAWLADNNADDANFIQSYGAMQFLGMDWRGLFFNADKPDTFLSLGYPAPKVNFNFWNFNSISPPFISPQTDLDRYAKLSSNIDSTLLYGSSGPANGSPNNWIQLVSAGPISRVAPGEKFNYTIAYVCSRKLVKPVSGSTIGTSAESRGELTEHFARTRATYVGEDVNETGKYDPDLDFNGNGKLDRFILPEPPNPPKLKVIASENKVDLYWDASSTQSIDPITRKKDFEGFKLYRTNAGDDLDQVITDDLNLIAQWDSAANAVGYNNGFDPIRLPNPVFFENDPTPYVFKYSMNQVKNGWQYLFALTAFDKGERELGIGPLESSAIETEKRVFPGTVPKEISEDGSTQVGVYPNPYKTTAAWDGNTSRTQKIYFTNLPAQCVITVYTSNGDLITMINHDAATYNGSDAKWYEVYGDSEKTVTSGGEHAWDLLSTSKTTLTSGVYLFTVEDKKTGNVELGKFVIIK